MSLLFLSKHCFVLLFCFLSSCSWFGTKNNDAASKVVSAPSFCHPEPCPEQSRRVDAGSKSLILEIDSIKQAYGVLESADTSTLVVFDCDEMLVEPADILIRAWTRNIKEFQELIKDFKWHVWWQSLLRFDFCYDRFLWLDGA